VVHIYAVRLSGGSRHEHITKVRWKNPDNDKAGENTRTQMIDWINGGGAAYVCGGGHLARVRVVKATPPYIRTYADGV
jgi:hypothetical protein